MTPTYLLPVSVRDERTHREPIAGFCWCGNPVFEDEDGHWAETDDGLAVHCKPEHCPRCGEENDA